MPSDISVEEALTIKAEHLDAFRYGNPFSRLQGEWNLQLDETPTCRPSAIDYNSGRLAWIEEHTRRLHVKNLESGQETLYMPPNREKIYGIRLSSRLIAGTTEIGKCYVWDCTTGTPYTIQLTSASVAALSASNKSLAVLQKTPIHEADTQEQFSVTTWNMDSLQARSFEVVLQGRWSRNSQDLLEIRMIDDSLLLLEPDMGPPDEIFYTRYTLDGKVIVKGSTGPLHRSFRSSYLDITTIPPQHSTFSASIKQLDCIKVLDEQDDDFRALRRQLVDSTHGLLRYQYDLRNNRITSTYSTTIPHFSSESTYAEGDSWVFWKDVAFRMRCKYNKHPWTTTFNLTEGAATDIHTQPFQFDDDPNTYYARGLQCPSRFPEHKEIGTFCDETFMVKVHSTHFVAFCFDKNIVMADDDEGFRQRRQLVRLKQIEYHNKVNQKEEVGKQGSEPTLEELEAKLAKHERELWAQQGIFIAGGELDKNGATEDGTD